MRAVKELREAKGWTQNQLAYHAGLATSVISQVENGKRDPSASTLRKLAEALSVNIPDLFRAAEDPKGSASPDSGHVGRRFGQYTDDELVGIRRQALTELVERTKDGAATRGAGVHSPADALIQLLDDVTSDANRRMNDSGFTVTDAQGVLNQIVGLNLAFAMFEEELTAWLSDTSALDAIDEKTANTIMRIDDFLEEQEANAVVQVNGAAVTDIESVRRVQKISADAKDEIRKHRRARERSAVAKESIRKHA